MFMMCSKPTKNIGVIAHDAEAVIIGETRLLRVLFEVKSTESIKNIFCGLWTHHKHWGPRGNCLKNDLNHSCEHKFDDLPFGVIFIKNPLWKAFLARIATESSSMRLKRQRNWGKKFFFNFSENWIHNLSNASRIISLSVMVAEITSFESRIFLQIFVNSESEMAFSWDLWWSEDVHFELQNHDYWNFLL